MMEKKMLTLVIATVFGMMTLVIPGCTANRTNLVDKGIVSVETEPSKKFEILWTDVYQNGEDFVVYGVMRRRSHTRYPVRAHVHVSILAPDGTILQKTPTPDIYVSRWQSGKGINWTRFRVRLPGRPVAGSRVNMVAHSVET
ncbi:MAG: hypothetical protein ACYTE8_09675 [Planctomycetota bacterium]|jgi:hypothetical protein